MAVTALSGQRWQGSTTDAKTPTYSDFSGTWTTTGTRVVESSEVVTVTMNTGSINDSVAFDLGDTLEDTWVLRYKQEATSNDVVGASGNEVSFMCGLSASATVSGSNQFPTACLYQRLRYNNDNWYLESTDIRSSDGSTTTASTRYNGLARGAVTFYVEVVKNGASSTVKYFEDSTFETQVGSTLTTNGTSSGSSLQYLTLHAYTETWGTGSAVLECSEFKIWDGATTATQDDKTTVTDVPVGSEFEQTNDYKSYQAGSLINGTTTGATLETSEKKFGTASVSFDGVDDYGTINDLVSAMTTTGTISMWFYIPSSIVSGKKLWGFGDTNGNEFLRASIESDNIDIKFRVAGTTQWQGNTGSSSISADTWYHFAITQDGTSPKFYLQGVDVTNSVSGDTDETAWITAGTGLDNFDLATLQFNSGTRADFGKFYCDDFAVWSSALPIGTDEDTVDSIKWLYNTCTVILSTTIPTNLKASYSMDSLTLTNQVISWIERGTAI